MGATKSIPALGSDLNKKLVIEVVTNFIHNNPHFKKFERDAIKDVIHKGVFESLGSSATKYIPHPSLAVPKPLAEKDEEAKHVRKGKKEAPLECKKKKDKFFCFREAS
ncbi:hypothetical protein R1flu_014368 [Riccia fluitans]|uniref:Uncharacterized protein n=1 Tax=Riccia fluitans TaxID=41844 RepID=A0ABD1YJ20_9MARC